ncbi:MAG: cytochrome c family protein [Alphaproteobacteria bacterium]
MGFRRACKAAMILLVSILSLGAPAMGQQARFEPEPEVERLPDRAHGEKLFKECRKCHEISPGQVKIGPSLAGIVGRRAGSTPGFGYSQDMIDLGAAGTVWNQTSLDRFLSRPRAMVAGTKMVFQGFRKQADRDDLIAYLSTI